MNTKELRKTVIGIMLILGILGILTMGFNIAYQKTQSPKTTPSKFNSSCLYNNGTGLSYPFNNLSEKQQSCLNNNYQYLINKIEENKK